MPLRTLWLALALALPAVAFQETLPRMDVDERFLRILATVYPAPEYPKPSIAAGHTGRVVVEVLVGPDGNNYTHTRVQSSKVVEAPDPEMAKAVLDALEKSRFTLTGPRPGQFATPVGRVVWEFRITDGKPEVIDPNAPSQTPPRPRPVLTADDLRIVRRARGILASEAIWNRADTRECPADLKTFSLYCALEKATQDVSGTFEHRGIVMEEARAAIDEITHQKDYEHRLMGYNNEPTTTFADIQKVLAATEERIARKLKAAQAQEAPQFEAASLKLSQLEAGRMVSGSHGGPGTADPGRWWAENLTVANLLMNAYSLKPYQLVRPSWMDATRLRIEAKVPPGATREQLNLMLRSLLAERFQMKVHREEKEMAILQLTVARNGPKLRPASAEKRADDQILGGMNEANGRVRWTHKQATTEMLALMLGLSLRVAVVDTTGLTGKYDVDLSWMPDRVGATQSEPGPTIYAALQEQLGLKLEQTKGVVEVVVVDAADRTPSGN
jgi:uncharacterized protein (TIGR03435 family)